MSGYNYERVLNIPGVCKYKCCLRFWIPLNMAEWCPMAGFWICLVNISQGFKQASGSKYAMTQNMSRLWIREGYKGCWICLNKPEYALIISKYEWICFNNVECDLICRHITGKTECWICQNYSECVWCSTYHKVTESIEQLPRQTYSEHCQTFKIKRFAKRIMPECRCATRNFSGQEEGFVKLGHFDKHFTKNIIRAFLFKIRKRFSP